MVSTLFVSRRGFILPIALLLILALSATSFSILIVARMEVLSEGGDHRYLRERIGEEERLAALISWEDSRGLQMEGVTGIPLAGGYVLVWASVREEAPASTSVYWRFIPDSAAYSLLPGALEVGGGGVPSRGVRAMTREEGCSLPPSGTSLVRVRRLESLPPPSPPLSLPPRLGPIGIAELLDLATSSLAMEGDFPPQFDGESQILRAPPGAVVVGGAGGGILLAEGDLYLAGGSYFRGAVVVRGSLFMSSEAAVDGVALVGGAAYLDGGSVIRGCPIHATNALDRPEFTRLHKIGGGDLLGRF